MMFMKTSRMTFRMMNQVIYSRRCSILTQYFVLFCLLQIITTLEGCDGCNGGITENPEEYYGDYTAQAVRLRPFLLQEYSKDFVENVCLIKMDTEEG